MTGEITNCFFLTFPGSLNVAAVAADADKAADAEEEVELLKMKKTRFDFAVSRK